MRTLVEVSLDCYECGGYVMTREYAGETPNGNSIGGRWVLRLAGEFYDVDAYRTDLAERNNFALEHLPQNAVQAAYGGIVQTPQG